MYRYMILDRNSGVLVGTADTLKRAAEIEYNYCHGKPRESVVVDDWNERILNAEEILDFVWYVMSTLTEKPKEMEIEEAVQLLRKWRATVSLAGLIPHGLYALLFMTVWNEIVEEDRKNEENEVSEPVF